MYKVFIFLLSSFSVQIFKYNCDGALGNGNFIWKIEEDNTGNQSKQIATITEVQQMVPRLEKAALAREIRKKYFKISGMSPVVQRSLVHFLTGQIPQ